MPSVGIIANPASGKDIRRLVAYGTVFDNQEKVNIVRRVLLGLSAAGVDQVVFMPDYFNIVQKAVDGLRKDQKLPFDLKAVPIQVTGTQIDTYYAACHMQKIKVGSIITLGGDGTNRQVAKGCGDIPILPISTGTNNVFPIMVEGTTAGLAAGAIALGLPDQTALLPMKKLVIYKNKKPIDIALVDAVILDKKFIGSRALWEMDNIKQAVLARGEPHNIGIASIGGFLSPLGTSDPKGLLINFNKFSGKRIHAPIAPGLILPIHIEHYREIKVGEKIMINCPCSMIALDGERELEVNKGDVIDIELTFDGPKVIQIKEALYQSVKKGFLI